MCRRGSPASGPCLALRHPVRTILTNLSRRRPGNEVNHPAFNLVLGHLLLIRQNTPTEYQPLSVGGDPNTFADLLFEFTNCAFRVHLFEFVIRPIQGLHCKGPHSCGYPFGDTESRSLSRTRYDTSYAPSWTHTQ